VGKADEVSMAFPFGLNVPILTINLIDYTGGSNRNDAWETYDIVMIFPDLWDGAPLHGTQETEIKMDPYLVQARISSRMR
jgi:hypothetical protein